MISKSRYDIIQKLLADLARTFAQLAGLDTPEALEEIREYYHSWLQIDPDQLVEGDPSGLLHYLLQERGLSVPQLELLAALLAKEAEILSQNQQIERAIAQLKKALAIFEYVEANAEVFSFNRLDRIQQSQMLYRDLSSKHDS
ncbi:MAG: hypothetical protein AAF146_00735 [Bacteroidota bacterium]